MDRRSFVKSMFCALGALAIPRLSYGLSDMELYFWLNSQVGAFYVNGEIYGYKNGFRIISGFDGPVMTPGGRIVVKPTPKGNFRVRWKHADHVNHHNIPMPYSMFFSGDCAIHAWAWDESLPQTELARHYSSSGCISLDLPVAKNLFDWTPPAGTPVYVWGYRT
jgi:lipoprotein-anchoring transpeptidase ErfK/SrfK